MQAEFAVSRGGERVPSCAVLKHFHESRRTFELFWQHVRGLFYLGGGGGGGRLCAAAIFSRDPSNDVKQIRDHANVPRVHQVSVCWAVMSKADFLLPTDPESPLPSWLTAPAPKSGAVDKGHKSAAFKNETANFSSLEAL